MPGATSKGETIIFDLISSYDDKLGVISIDTGDESDRDDNPADADYGVLASTIPSVARWLDLLLNGDAVLMYAEDVIGKSYGMDQGPTVTWVPLTQRGKDEAPDAEQLDEIDGAAYYTSGLSSIGLLADNSSVMVCGATALVPPEQLTSDTDITEANYRYAVR